MQYDRAEYQRRKLRRLEDENEALKKLNDKLFRLMAVLVEMAARGTPVSELTLLAVVEEVDALREDTP
jgi:hypothetical protein